MNLRLILGTLAGAVLVVSFSHGTKAASVKPRPTAAAPSTVLSPAAVSALWRTPLPPYPKTARFYKREGKILLEVTTDAKGHILRATILKVDKSANVYSLRSTVLLWAWYHWTGPPNSKAIFPIEFKMLL